MIWGSRRVWVPAPAAREAAPLGRPREPAPARERAPAKSPCDERDTTCPARRLGAHNSQTPDWVADGRGDSGLHRPQLSRLNNIGRQNLPSIWRGPLARPPHRCGGRALPPRRPQLYGPGLDVPARRKGGGSSNHRRRAARSPIKRKKRGRDRLFRNGRGVRRRETDRQELE